MAKFEKGKSSIISLDVGILAGKTNYGGMSISKLNFSHRITILFLKHLYFLMTTRDLRVQDKCTVKINFGYKNQ